MSVFNNYVNKLPLSLVRNKLKKLGAYQLEVLLLIIVCLFLFIWFEDTFKTTQQTNYQVLSDNYLIGDDIKRPTTSWQKDLLCLQQEPYLSNDARTWCQKNYPAQGIYWLLDKFGYQPKADSYQHAMLNIEFNQYYQTIQNHFKKVISAPQNTDDVFADSPVNSSMLNHLSEKYHLNQRYGSTPLSCSWWYLYALEKSSPPTKIALNDLNLARADLLLHKKNADLFLSQTTTAANWQILKQVNQENLAKQCQKIGSVEQVFTQTTETIKTLYDYSDNYQKTLQTFILAKSGHIIFLTYVLTCFIVLTIMQRSLPPIQKLMLYLLLWSGVYISLNTFAHYVMIEDFWQLILSVTALSLCSIMISDKKSYSYQYSTISVIVYPILVLILGLSAFFILDWSLLSNYQSLRFLAVNQFSYICLGLMLLSIAPLLKDGLYELISRLIDVFYKILGIVINRQTHQPLLKNVLIVLTAILLLTIFLALNKNKYANLSSEVMRVIFILLSAGFVSLLPKISQQKSIIVFGSFALTILFAVFYVGGALTDFGPLMIVTYTMIVLMTAKILVWMSTKSWSKKIQPIAQIAVFLLLMSSLFYSAYHSFIEVSERGTERTRERVVSMREPFASTSDQMALTRYFAASVPNEGYGLGGVPWRVENGRGMPNQTQSDYVPVALYGLLGSYKFFAFSMVYFLWIATIVVGYKKLTEGYNSIFTHKEMITTFFSWVAVIWSTIIISQVCITVMGNLGIAPLTGVSWPFISYGQVSLAINCFILGCILLRVKQTPTINNT